jgi:hypothetical protein
VNGLKGGMNKNDVLVALYLRAWFGCIRKAGLYPEVI